MGRSNLGRGASVGGPGYTGTDADGPSARDDAGGVAAGVTGRDWSDSPLSPVLRSAPATASAKAMGRTLTPRGRHESSNPAERMRTIVVMVNTRRAITPAMSGPSIFLGPATWVCDQRLSSARIRL